MASLYPKFDGEAVTRTFSRLLWDCRHNGWKGKLTSGKRSRVHQLYLYRAWLRRLPGFNPANPPDRSAHCRNGWRSAVDITRADELMAVALRRGWPVHRPYLSREPWHVELKSNPAGLLAKLAAARAKREKAKPARPTRISTRGLEMIARFEGFVARPYNDPAGHATIGYGHLLHHGAVTAADKAKWGTITRARGLELLREDARSAERAVDSAVKPVLTQNQFDALVSFTFNVGAGAFTASTMRRKLNRRDFAGAADEFPRWNKAGGAVLPGLTRRRAAERTLFLIARARR